MKLKWINKENDLGADIENKGRFFIILQTLSSIEPCYSLMLCDGNKQIELDYSSEKQVLKQKAEQIYKIIKE